jgi:hypothetical protein
MCPRIIERSIDLQAQSFHGSDRNCEVGGAWRNSQQFGLPELRHALTIVAIIRRVSNSCALLL